MLHLVKKTNPKRWKGARVENLILLSNQGYKGAQIASLLHMNVLALYKRISLLRDSGVLVGALGALAFQNDIEDDVLLRIRERRDEDRKAYQRAWFKKYYALHRDKIRARQRRYNIANRDEINRRCKVEYYAARGWSAEDINKLIDKT